MSSSPDYGLSFKLDYPADQDENRNSDIQNHNFQASPEERKTLVILVGWSGAKDKQLAKYSEIYSKLGFITARCTIPAKVTYSDIAKVPLLAAQILNNLRENHLQDHPTFFHVFSNGGALLYSNILRELSLHWNHTEFDVRGTIFDSGPTSPNSTSVYRAVKITCSYKLFGIDLGSLIATLVVLVALVRVFWGFNVLAWETFYTGSFRRVATSREEKYPLCEFLTRIYKLKNHSFAFLYSEADVITPCEEIELVASVIRDRGNPVKLFKFDGSGHVLHYRMHPEMYIEACTGFINRCLKSYNGPTIYWDE